MYCKKKREGEEERGRKREGGRERERAGGEEGGREWEGKKER